MRRILLFLFTLSLILTAAEMPLAGVWKLNTAKSHFSHGTLPLSLVLTIEADGSNSIKYSSKNHLADGSSGGASYRAKFDGKDYPVTGSPSYDTVSIQRVNANTFNIQMKKASAVIVDTVYTISSDGKSLNRKGTAKKGPEDVNHFDEWFDRQ